MQVLRSLLRGPHELVGVLTSPPAENTRDVSLWKVAEKGGVPTWPARRVKDAALAGEIRALGVDLLLNVHSLYLIHAAVVGAAKIGSFNLHPGKLPEYAGLNSASWAIYEGAAQAGVTLHRMTAGIDTGDIAWQTVFPIAPTDTALSVNARCVREGVALIARLLETAGRDPAAIPRLVQDRSQRRYFGREIPAHGRLDWDAPAARVLAFVRACDYAPFPSPWGHPRTLLSETELGIVKAHPTGEPCSAAPGTIGTVGAHGVRVATADRWIEVALVEMDGQMREADGLLPAGQRLQAPQPCA